MTNDQFSMTNSQYSEMAVLQKQPVKPEVIFVQVLNLNLFMAEEEIKTKKGEMHSLMLCAFSVILSEWEWYARFHTSWRR